MEEDAKTEDKPSPFPLQSGGGVIPELSLRYEPLGNYAYAWNFGGCARGFSYAYKVKDEKNKPTGEWHIKIDAETFSFAKKPLGEVLFETPNHDFIKEWANGKQPTPSGKRIYEDLTNYLRVFLDLPHESDYDIAAILALQTWLRDLVSSFVFGQSEAAFGAAKTTSLECLTPVLYHGVLSSSITGAEWLE